MDSVSSVVFVGVLLECMNCFRICSNEVLYRFVPAYIFTSSLIDNIGLVVPR